MAPETVAATDGELRVYGSQISYFTGKLEAYLRYKEIPYTLVPMTSRLFSGLVPEKTGAAQMPAVELPDGRWITDTTPMIAWFETRQPKPPVIPEDPLQAFASRLLEDYADEWLWRPALHYRWSYPNDRNLLSELIVDELLGGIPLPGALKRLLIQRRQFGRAVKGDGVDAATREHVEGSYLRALDFMSAALATRPFLLGDAPTLADFGLMGPMFRHFSHDPTPARIMRNRAPRVYAWVARMWNARASEIRGGLVDGVPEDWGPLLGEIGATHLEHLCANALAFAEGREHFDVAIQSVTYRNLPTSRYRVWCLERLRAHYQNLPSAARDAARTLLESHGCFEPLWRVDDLDSGLDPDEQAPFAPSLPVYPT
jgi:glutathione S-transferase